MISKGFRSFLEDRKQYTTIHKASSDKHLNSASHPPKKICVICFIESPLKMMKKCVLFNLKSSFRSQEI